MNKTIEKVEPITAGYRLKLSEQEEPLDVPYELYHKHLLKAGIVLTAAQIEQLNREIELFACKATASRLLALRGHSVGELFDKLKRRKFSDEAITPVIKEFKSAGVLDDARYANALVRRSLERNPSGRSFLIATLKKKKIAHDLAEEIVDMAIVEDDEDALAERSLRKRWPVLKQFDIERARTKAYTYLSRRGISYSAAKAAFEKLSAECEGGDDN
ncbi:MAG: regulatory protein RecX [candidate division Zixibacteria bacterium]|nr:regulatory protein RecX [candidate division Zixibacteria bacterium]